MFSSGTILHISNYDFEDCKTQPKNKYLVVLHNDNNTIIIGTLTSSQDYVPDEHKKDGCVKVDEKCIHCFYFPANKLIGEKGYSFSKDTFVYIERNIFTREISYLKSKYGDKGSIAIEDKLTKANYKELLTCIHKSQFIPRGIKRMLEAAIKTN